MVLRALADIREWCTAIQRPLTALRGMLALETGREAQLKATKVWNQYIWVQISSVLCTNDRFKTSDSASLGFRCVISKVVQGMMSGKRTSILRCLILGLALLQV